MAVSRSRNFKSLPLDVVGSSVFGRYPKINSQYTYNMIISQDALVNYPGYKVGIPASTFRNATTGRGALASPKLGKIVAVFDTNVFILDFTFSQQNNEILFPEISFIGSLGTKEGEVFITENNKPQVVISDGSSIYVYDEQASQFTGTISSVAADTITYTGERDLIEGEKIVFNTSAGNIVAGVTYFVTAPSESVSPKTFKIATTPTQAFLENAIALGGTGTGTFDTQGRFQEVQTTFRPGMIDFHDTYILAVASDDTLYSPPANNTWRLSAQNNAFLFPDDTRTVGLLETKPDNTLAIFRFPSVGNMIFVMGETVTESWFDTGAQLFPYQRNNQYNIDYGCINPKTVAHLDHLSVWLSFNEKSGPIIMYSEGSTPKRISTDGIDFFFSQLQNPEDSAAFIYRQDGHTLYHLNFFSDNYSLIYDFNTQKFFNASDQNFEEYRMDKVIFFDNQNFAMTRKDGNFYIFDTTITTFSSPNAIGTIQEYEIPRSRTTSNIRLPSQDYFIVNDIGFTIETGETNYLVQKVPNDDEIPFTLITEGGDTLITEAGDTLVTDNLDPNTLTFTHVQSTPRVDLALSYNGGASFDSFYAYELPHIGKRRNRVMWWQGGICNDLVCKFNFVGIGRVVAIDGVVNIR